MRYEKTVIDSELKTIQDILLRDRIYREKSGNTHDQIGKHTITELYKPTIIARSEQLVSSVDVDSLENLVGEARRRMVILGLRNKTGINDSIELHSPYYTLTHPEFRSAVRVRIPSDKNQGTMRFFCSILDPKYTITLFYSFYKKASVKVEFNGKEPNQSSPYIYNSGLNFVDNLTIPEFKFATYVTEKFMEYTDKLEE